MIKLKLEKTNKGHLITINYDFFDNTKNMTDIRRFHQIINYTTENILDRFGFGYSLHQNKYFSYLREIGILQCIQWLNEKSKIHFKTATFFTVFLEYPSVDEKIKIAAEKDKFTEVFPIKNNVIVEQIYNFQHKNFIKHCLKDPWLNIDKLVLLDLQDFILSIKNISKSLETYLIDNCHLQELKEDITEILNKNDIYNWFDFMESKFNKKE